ncbi:MULTISPECIES: transporter substrate-binding domain-containing protein [Thalassospira]|nr:transporter substrate-binding domain-containing protein [Thalassospira profundimaris]
MGKMRVKSNVLAVFLAFCAFYFFPGTNAVRAADPIIVKVGAYEYGVVYFYQDGKAGGIVPKLINLLNGLQDEYQFQLAETSSRRRYQALMNGELDLVLLESAQWDWPDYDVHYSDPIVREKDIYLALSSRTDAQELFSDVTAHRMLCVLGFHYGFADYNGDPEYLRKNFNVLLRYNEAEVLDGLFAGEAPIAVVSAGFLARQFVQDPGMRNRLVIAGKPDATYDLVSVLSKDSAIPLDAFNKLVAELIASGEVERLWRQLHIGVSG